MIIYSCSVGACRQLSTDPFACRMSAIVLHTEMAKVPQGVRWKTLLSCPPFIFKRARSYNRSMAWIKRVISADQLRPRSDCSSALGLCIIPPQAVLAGCWFPSVGVTLSLFWPDCQELVCLNPAGQMTLAATDVFILSAHFFFFGYFFSAYIQNLALWQNKTKKTSM